MELAFSVDGVLHALAAQPRRGRGVGRAIMFIAARAKEGVTTAARAVAEAVGPGAVYAIDLDLKRNAIGRAISEIAPLGPKSDGAIAGTRFYVLRGPNGAAIAEHPPVFSFHRAGRTRIHAGVFDPRLLPPRTKVAISSAPHYWDAVRSSGATAVVDAPALERSELALKVVRHMDGVVLVVGADAGAAPAARAAKDAMTAAGANIMGLVYSGATAPVMAIERLLRQTG
jgi:hypothetical protein